MKKQSIYVLVFGLLAGLLLVTEAYAYGTGVFVNGRHLSQTELRQLEYAIGTRIPAARYWVNPANGLWGYEGGPAMGYVGGNNQGSTYHHNSYTGISAGSSGGCTYVMGSDFSYTGSGC